MELEIRNATIESTMLGIEDHGVMTFWLTLNYGGSGQGAGGFGLDEPIWEYPDRTGMERGHFLRRQGTAMGLDAIMQVLDVVGVQSWEDLKGKHVRAKCSNSRVSAIGHILEDKWIDFEQFFETWKQRPLTPSPQSPLEAVTRDSSAMIAGLREQIGVRIRHWIMAGKYDSEILLDSITKVLEERL